MHMHIDKSKAIFVLEKPSVFDASHFYSMLSAQTLYFKVSRRNPELVPPAEPTPHEFKPLSDIDDQEGLRFNIKVIKFYRSSPAMGGRDPVGVIREALGKALVFYYPFAGRLREGASRKLSVDCTGEGAMFIEADADVELREFRDAGLRPPFPYLAELLYDVRGSSGVINCPLLLIQVTRLKCGGFIFALSLNHTMSDGTGLGNFLSAVGELARGVQTPSIPPVWHRELLRARDPPRVTCTHRVYDEPLGNKEMIIAPENMVSRCFFFGKAEKSALLRHLPPRLHNCTTFELLAACLWRCRTIAMSPDRDEEVRIVCIVNARPRLSQLLPAGYYGNAIAYPVACAAAGKLSENPLQYAVDLVRKAKSAVTEEYMKSLADFLVTKGRPNFMMVGSYLISDVTRGGYGEVDFGWGKPEYGGPGHGCTRTSSHFIPSRNDRGESGILVPVCLSRDAVEVFARELEILLKKEDVDAALVKSAL